jgi:riboflavin synthase
MLQRVSSHAARIHCPDLAGRVGQGDSVAVNGVCLTVVRLAQESFEADLLKETLDTTTLGLLADGSQVNVEPALRVGDVMGGHQVLGHIDGTIHVTCILDRLGAGRELRLELPDWLNPYTLEKGSIAVDGVSLTIQSVGKDNFTVGLITATLTATNLGDIAVGERVNIEIDYLVKTVRKSVEQLLPAMLADRGQDWSRAASHEASEGQ